MCGVLMGVAMLAAPARAEPPRVIDRADYADRLRAMWMAESIANWTGLRTEGLVTTPPFLTDAAWGTSPFPDRPWVHLDLYLYADPWGADDDTDIEYVYLHAMRSTWADRLSPETIAQQWIEHVNAAIWVSNADVRALMGAGVRPPMTALAQGLHPLAPTDHSLYIDAQLTTEMFGALCPGMPERALEMADLPIRTTARGYAAHAAQFYVVLYALATRVDPALSGREQALWLVRSARAYIPDTSKSADVIDFVLADFLDNPDTNDWERTRDRVHERYRANAVANGFVYRDWTESSVNLACGVIALLYGGMDFERTVRIGTLTGWDSDNGTATMGGLLGLVQGRALLDRYPGVSDRYWITRTRNNLPDYTPGPVVDGEDTFTLMGERMLPLIDREVAKAGGVPRVLSAAAGGRGVWVLPPPAAGANAPAAAALALSPTQREWMQSATWSVRRAGGTVSGSCSVPGAPESGHGSGNTALIVDGQESDWRGLEELGSPRGFLSTQRAGANPPGAPQWFAAVYDRPVTVQTIRFMGGPHDTPGPMTGGWFETITPQVLVDGAWTTPALAIVPRPDAGAPFARLDFVLAAPIQATGVRVLGVAGGTGRYVTCMELDALSPAVRATGPTFDLDHNGALSIDDLYRWFAAPVDLNGDGVVDGADAAYLETALRAEELAGMGVRR